MANGYLSPDAHNMRLLRELDESGIPEKAVCQRHECSEWFVDHVDERVCECGHVHSQHHKGWAYGLETFHCEVCGCPEFSGGPHEYRCPDGGGVFVPSGPEDFCDE